MIKKIYDQMTDRERMIYDELCEFSRKLADRLDVMTEIMKKILIEATRE